MEENQNNGMPNTYGVTNENIGVDNNRVIVNGADYVSDNGGYVTSEHVTGGYVTSQATVQEDISQVQVQEEATQEVQTQKADTQEAVQEKLPDLDPDTVRIIVKTNLLKDALKKADIVSSKIDLQPITEIVMFRVVSENMVQVRATDRDNILTVDMPVIQATQGAIMTLKVASLKSLVDKISSEIVTFVIDGVIAKVITVDGEYSFQQSLDLTTNEVIVIPDVDKDSILFEDTREISKDKLLPSLEYIYPIVQSAPDTHPHYAIHFGKIISGTANNDVGAVIEDASALFGTEALVKLSTVKDIMTMGVGDKLNIGFGQLGNSKTMCIYTGNYRLYSVLKEGEDEYPSEEIEELVNAPVSATIKLNKSRLLKAIDRLSLFYTSNVMTHALDAEVNGSQLKISNENRAFEVFMVTCTSNVKIKFDVNKLSTCLKSVKGEEITISTIQEEQDAPVSRVKVSNGDDLVYIIGTAI